MTNESQPVQETTPVEVISDNPALVKEETPEQKPNEVQQEIQALIDAIRTKAQSEVQKVGNFTREQFLDAVRNAREQVDKLNFDPNKVEEAMEKIQDEVEKNWDSLAKEITSVGDRLTGAAKAAWEVLTSPRNKDKSE